MRQDMLLGVIRSAHLSEKSAILTEKSNQVVFKVAPSANKIAIRKAVESIFDVSVEKVTTSVVKGKVKRFGRGTGKRSNWKKAYVTLSSDSKLDFSEISTD